MGALRLPSPHPGTPPLPSPCPSPAPRHLRWPRSASTTYNMGPKIAQGDQCKSLCQPSLLTGCCGHALRHLCDTIGQSSNLHLSKWSTKIILSKTCSLLCHVKDKGFYCSLLVILLHMRYKTTLPSLCLCCHFLTLWPFLLFSPMTALTIPESFLTLWGICNPIMYNMPLKQEKKWQRQRQNVIEFYLMHWHEV